MTQPVQAGTHADVPRVVLSIRVEPHERTAWQAAAKAAGIALADWIRLRVNGKADVLEVPPPPVLKPTKRRR